MRVIQTWQSDLYCTESVEQVRVVADAGADASTLMLARLDELGDLITVHAVELVHEVHYSQPPIDSTHS